MVDNTGQESKVFAAHEVRVGDWYIPCRFMVVQTSLLMIGWKRRSTESEISRECMGLLVRFLQTAASTGTRRADTLVAIENARRYRVQIQY